VPTHSSTTARHANATRKASSFVGAAVSVTVNPHAARSALVLLPVLSTVLVAGCATTAEWDNAPAEHATEAADPSQHGARPWREHDPRLAYLHDAPKPLDGWQCVACLGEAGRVTYTCSEDVKGPYPGTCFGSDKDWYPALSLDLSGCVGVWLDAEAACLVTSEHARTLLAMCGTDSDDVAMLCD
jgi:hypothetical protein